VRNDSYQEVVDCKGVPNYLIFTIKRKKYDTALVIPIINEGERIIQQIRSIRSKMPMVDIVIADGGSNDGTIEALSKEFSGVTSILIKTGTGKLSAQLRMAFHYCLEKNYKYVITMDGNNKDGPDGILGIRQALVSGFDFVQGSRFKKGGIARNTPLIRLIAIRFIHAPITSLAALFWFTDTTNGFRGHSRDLLQSQQLMLFRDVFQTYEMIAFIPIEAKKNGFRVCEVAVERSYPVDGVVPTKIHGIKSQFQLLLILISASLGKYSLRSNHD
jgi:dolichol-phosphate mannosyltransferase